MRYTFKPDDCMVITIPLASIRNARDGQLMPDKFTCRFKDSYKVFQQGHPKALGAAQIITAVFILCLGGILMGWSRWTPHYIHMIPCIVHIVCGILVIAAGHTPLMPLMKASFIFNILCLCSAIIAISLCITLNFGPWFNNKILGLHVIIIVLYAFEFLLSVILIHWESKALCRSHFNSLPMITLKQDL